MSAPQKPRRERGDIKAAFTEALGDDGDAPSPYTMLSEGEDSAVLSPGAEAVLDAGSVYATAGSTIPDPNDLEVDTTVEDIAMMLSNRSAPAVPPVQSAVRPKLVVSSSGRFQDQFYHASEASRAFGKLKARAYAKQNAATGSGTGKTKQRKRGANVNGRDSEQFSDADIVYAGYLVKQGSFWKTWKRRYFILRRDVPVLAYYSSQENLVKLGEITVDTNTTATAEPTDALPHRFIVEHENRKLVLIAEDGDDAVATWLKWISQVIGWRKLDEDRQSNITRTSSCSITGSLLLPRKSNNGSTIEATLAYIQEPPPAPASAASSHASKFKRNSTDSRAIQAVLDELAAAYPDQNEERDRLLRASRLKRVEAATKERPRGVSTAVAVDTPLGLPPRSGATTIGFETRPTTRPFRSFSAESVLTTHSTRTGATLARDESTRSSLSQSDFPRAENEGRNAASKTPCLSLPSFRPLPSIALAVSVGSRGTQDVTSMVVALSTVVPGGELNELTRTEVQGTLWQRSIGADYNVRDFSALLTVPLTTRDVLHFEVFSIVDMGTEALSAQISLGFVRISPLDLLFSRDASIVLECRPSQNSPVKQSNFIVLERVVPSKIMEFSHAYTYATRHFVVDAASLHKNASADTALIAPDVIQNGIRFAEVARHGDQSTGVSHVLITEELAASYCTVSVSIEYIRLVQARNKQRVCDANQTIQTIEERYKPQPSSPRQSRSASVITLDTVQLQEARANSEHYSQMHETYVACEKYYQKLQSMLERGKETGITGCMKRSTQKKDKLTEFMATNVHCHLMRARRIRMSTDSGPKTTPLTRASSLSPNTGDEDELLHAVVTHGCMAAHCMGFKDGGLRRMLQSYAQSLKDRRSDVRLHERIEQRQDIVRCQVLTVAATAFFTAVGLAVHSAEHRDRLELMCKTGLLVSIESLLSTIKHERGMLEDMAEGVAWLNSGVSIQVVQLMDQQKLPHAKCIGITSSGVGDGVIATFAVPPALFATLPAPFQDGLTIGVTAVLFTQGINEMQTVANKMLDTSLQDEINLESVQRLIAFFVGFKTYAQEGASSLRKRQLDQLEADVHALVEKVRPIKKGHTQRKNVNILIESSELCRRLGAMRTICCKSGKDRTGMSVTLECSRLLVDKFHVTQGVHICNAMRERGVRRVNVLTNTGKQAYAFNTLQLKCLPDCYRPPVATADSKVVS